MRKYLLFLFSVMLLSMSVYAAMDHYYEIALHYNRGEISLQALRVLPVTSEERKENLPGGFIAEVKAAGNEVLNVTFFDVPLVVLYDFFDNGTGEATGGGILELNETDVLLSIPYFPNAKEINIYDSSMTKKLTIDVSPYAKQGEEKRETEIPKEQGREEKELPSKEREETKSEEQRKYFLIGLIVLVFLLAILFWRHFERG